MNCLYAICFRRPRRRWGFSKEQIENTLTAQSPALKSRPMAVRDILILPDKRLRQVSKPVAKVDASIKKLVEDMFDTMYDAPGIGLAAIQIGERSASSPWISPRRRARRSRRCSSIPEIVDESDEQSVHEEGCLSIPEYYEEVERPASVTVKYLDLAGKEHEVKATGLLAVCLQHEIDHLNGVLFIDHISKLKRDRVVKKFTKAAKQAAKDTAKDKSSARPAAK